MVDLCGFFGSVSCPKFGKVLYSVKVCFVCVRKDLVSAYYFFNLIFRVFHRLGSCVVVCSIPFFPDFGQARYAVGLSGGRLLGSPGGVI